MAIDNTLNPERTNRPGAMLQHDGLMREHAPEPMQQMQMQSLQAAGVQCPQCGTMNDPEAAFCESCGAPLRMANCPNCGSLVEPDADFCEVCHRYIRKDICSFCGAHLMGQEPFCPECGSPRGGIACPNCHTINDFSFCKQCGTPLTEEAHQLVKQMKQMPEYQMVTQLAREYAELETELPIATEADAIRQQENDSLRERVLRLLAQDKGVPNPVIPAPKVTRVSKEELDRKKKEALEKITEMLDKMAIPQQPTPAKARNYAMAQKPSGVRLAWVCNYKNAMHSSPCGCAKPQLGGKWIVLGHNSKNEIKDDK